MLTRLKMVGVAVVATVLMAAPAAYASPVIDFSTGLAGVGGTISWDGTNLIGSNIPIGAVSIDGADMNNGVYLVNGMATGQGGGSYGSLDFNTAANVITITGCIPGLNVGTINGNGACTTPVALMDGTFSGWDTNGRGLLNAFGMDTKNSALLEAIDFPTDLPWQFFGFSMTTRPLNPNGTPGSVNSTDINNAAVPEPATMMLLGTGLLAAFRARRRQA